MHTQSENRKGRNPFMIMDFYLAGTIYEEDPHKSWKQKFGDILAAAETEDTIFGFFDPNPLPGSCTTDIISYDKQRIQHCDALVAYIQRLSVGTIMEIFYAKSLGKPVYVIDFNGKNKLENNLWLRGHCDCVFNSVEDCASHILKMVEKTTKWL